MLRRPKLPNRTLAISLTFAGMWLLSFTGIYVLVHFVLAPPNQWWFNWCLRVIAEGWVFAHKYSVWNMVLFYFAWTSVQLPGAIFAAIVIVLSGFRYPLRATFWTVAIYHTFLTLVRIFVCPPWHYHDVDPSDLIYFCTLVVYLVFTLLLIGASVFVAWLILRRRRFLPGRSAF